MSWLLLVVAGLLEVAWAVGLKQTDGFRRVVPTALVVSALVGSVWMLSVAARKLPIGTAYAVWVGIGALGAALFGILVYGEPAGAGRLFFLGLLLVAIIGLKLTS